MSAPDRDREIEEIALALREDAPQPDPAFVHEMDRRVAEGFGRPRLRLPRIRWRLLTPALAAAAGVILAVLVAAGVFSGSGGEQSGVPAVTKTESLSAPSASAFAGSARKVERSAEMTLAAQAGKLQQMADGVAQVAAASGGYVSSSEVSTGDAGARSGRFVLRIPQQRLEAALADIGRLGRVTARSESSQDMTAPYNHVQDRLANALLERRAVRDRLRFVRGAKAERLRARLRALNAEIRGLGGQMRDLRRRTSMTTVTVSLEEDRGGTGGGIAGGDPGAALHDALAVLAGGLNVAIRLLPVALLVMLGWLGSRALRRRRREAALV